MYGNSRKRGAHGWNALHLAAAHGDEASLKNLTQHGKPSHRSAGNGKAHNANGGGAYKSLDVLFGKKHDTANVCSIEEPTSNGDRALHVALRNGQVHAAHILVDAGADIAARGNNGETVIHICAELDLTRELDWLKAKGDSAIINVETDDGKRAAHYAAAGNRVSVLDWLLQAKCTTQFISRDHFGDTPLHLAARSGSEAAADWLISFAKKSGLGRSLLAGNKANKDPATIAKECGNFAMARSIEAAKQLQQSARRNWRTAGGSFLEHSRDGDLASLKALLESNDPSLVDYKHHKTTTTATLEAAKHGQREVLEWLLAQPGTRVNVNSRNGKSILHEAAQKGHLDLVRFCVEDLDIDPSRTTALGATAASLAKENNHPEVSDWLEEVERTRRSATGPVSSPAGDKPGLSSAVKSTPNIWSPAGAGSTEAEGAKKPPGLTRHMSQPSGVIASQTSFGSGVTESGEGEQGELAELLHELGLLEWLPVLCEDGFDSIRHILNLLEGDLVSLGMKKGHRRALLQAVDQLKEQQPSLRAGSWVRRYPDAEAFVDVEGSLVAGKNNGNGGGKKRQGNKKKPKRRTRTERRNRNKTRQQQRGHDNIVVEDDGAHQFNRSSSNGSSETPSSMESVADGAVVSREGGPFGRVSMVLDTGEVNFENSEEHLLREGDVIRCTCDRWKQQLGEFKNRVCEHIIEFHRHDAMGEFQPSAPDPGIDRSQSTQARPPSPKLAPDVRRVLSDPAGQQQREDDNGAKTPLKRQESLSESLGAHHILQWSEIKLGFVIGEGSFGIVRAGVWRGMHVAVKELRLSAMLAASPSKQAGLSPSLPQGSFEPAGLTVRAATQRGPSHSQSDHKQEQWDLRHEAVVLSRVCNHENIVPFLGVVLEPRPSVVTRLMPGGSVDQMLVSPGPKNRRTTTTFAQMVQMMVDAAAGVLHLHREGVIHRDLAARNLLVDEHGRVRLSDFGFARVKEQNASKGYTSQHIGPIKWMSPEALRFRQFSECSDVFGFGVTLYEVITGNRPWEGVETMDVVFRVCNGERLAKPYGPDPHVANLVQACMLHNPKHRPSMEQVHQVLINVLEREQSRVGSSAAVADTPVTIEATQQSPTRHYVEFNRRRS